METRQSNEPVKAVNPLKPTITYDDFARLDIRTGNHHPCRKSAKTKKLLKFELDTGIDKRTVISGIAEAYDPQDLAGRKVVLLATSNPETSGAWSPMACCCWQKMTKVTLPSSCPKKNSPTAHRSADTPGSNEAVFFFTSGHFLNYCLIKYR
jgi:hypothetical protein